jgi:PadR family transcriptional regulator, regulatory protein PadR
MRGPRHRGEPLVLPPTCIDRTAAFACHTAALMPNAYGLAIGDHIEHVTGRTYSIGAVYSALDRLEGRGFLESRQGEATATRGGRRKLYFDLTATGQLALKQSLAMIDKLQKTPARVRGAFA